MKIVIISFSESADTKPLCILIPEKLELKVNSESSLVTILSTWWHIFVPAGENEAASCIAIECCADLMPFAGRISHGRQTIYGDVSNPLPVFLSDNPIATVFCMSASVSNYLKKLHAGEHRVNLSDFIADTSIGIIVSDE